jgi:hypothetical protein
VCEQKQDGERRESAAHADQTGRSRSASFRLPRR